MHARIAGPTQSQIARSPRERVLVLGRRIGEESVARWCAELLLRTVRIDDPGRPSIVWLGGRSAAAEIRRGRLASPVNEYWARVWGARGLMYVWVPGADTAVLAGLRDPAWRVREMSAKVVRVRGIARAEQILSRMLDDSVARVRGAADSALAALLALEDHAGLTDG